MKKTCLLVALLLFTSSLLAQTVELNKKDNTINIDGSAVLKYKKKQLVNWSLYNLKGEELVYFTTLDNGTPGYAKDDYYAITFIEQNVKVESNDYTNIQTFFNFNKALQKFVTWLVEEKVMNLDGTINEDKLQAFYTKYDQNITNRTIRY
jgi:hypothetical protein